MRAARLALAALLLVPAAPRAARARVVRVVVDRRADVGGGHAFGAAGAYERLAGRVFFAFDPRNPRDRQIVDLARAPRNARGEVEAWAEFVLLRPKDPRRASGVTLLDVVNRGGITTGVFHLGADRDQPPDSAAHYGDALLLRRGLTVVALGWQWDVPPGGDPLGAGPLHFHPPVVTGGGAAGARVTGLVRSDVTVDAPARTIPLGHRVGASQAVGYPVLDPDDATATLTERDGPLAERRVVPRAEWRFAREEGGQAVRDSTSVYRAAGFTPGHVYEVVYRAADPVVTGTGLAAVRDLMSWLKYDSASLAPTRWGVAYGVSQTGRFLRHFLYQGFNTDERGRRAFDGVFAHTAGAGRGSFNHRFAQPSRDAQPYSTFFYPTDLFPFTSPEERDPETGALSGLRTPASLHNAPKVFYVDGGYEYWGRAASLTHTTVDGARDVGFLPSERRYVMSSAQHSGPASPSGAPPAPAASIAEGDTAGAPAWRGNPLDQRLLLRGLLVALVDWVRDGRTPPPSTYPTLAAGTLVPAAAVRFPAVPGVRLARAPYAPVRLDLGPDWAAGVVDREPPRTGAPYAVRVAQVDSLGNDLGGVRAAELEAPLATYFPWQLRAPALAASDRLVSFQGTFVPLPRTEAERQGSGDPRPSLERLYGSRAAYLARVGAAARGLVARRFMLDEDVARAQARLAAAWDWLAGR